MPTLLQLRSFLAVVDQGGFTTAAQQLNLTQPAVSRAVAGLEKELGLPLLRRHRDGVTLTAAGERAAEHARHAVNHMQLMRAEVAALAGQLTGTLRVASLPFATGTMLAPRLRAFSDEHRGVTVHLIEGSEPEIRDWLQRGAADVGVVSLPARGLETAELGIDEMVAVLPTGHRLAGLDAVSYAELGCRTVHPVDGRLRGGVHAGCRRGGCRTRRRLRGPRDDGGHRPGAGWSGCEHPAVPVRPTPRNRRSPIDSANHQNFGAGHRPGRRSCRPGVPESGRRP